jgi:hypothetical protein
VHELPKQIRLKKKFIIAPLSNGNVSLLADMAKNAGLPWEAHHWILQWEFRLRRQDGFRSSGGVPQNEANAGL